MKTEDVVQIPTVGIQKNRLNSVHREENKQQVLNQLKQKREMPKT